MHSDLIGSGIVQSRTLRAWKTEKLCKTYTNTLKHLEQYKMENLLHLCVKYLLAAKTAIQPKAIPITKPTGENPLSSLESNVGESNPSSLSDFDNCEA